MYMSLVYIVVIQYIGAAVVRYSRGQVDLMDGAP